MNFYALLYYDVFMTFYALLYYDVFMTFYAFYTMTFLFLTIPRSEAHTSELQSPSTNSYAVFCLKKKKYLACGNPHTWYHRLNPPPCNFGQTRATDRSGRRPQGPVRPKRQLQTRRSRGRASLPSH